MKNYISGRSSWCKYGRGGWCKYGGGARKRLGTTAFDRGFITTNGVLEILEDCTEHHSFHKHRPCMNIL